MIGCMPINIQTRIIYGDGGGRLPVDSICQKLHSTHDFVQKVSKGQDSQMERKKIEENQPKDIALKLKVCQTKVQHFTEVRLFDLMAYQLSLVI